MGKVCESVSKSDILRRLYEVFWRLKIYDNILWATYVTQWGIFYCTTFIQSVTNYIHGVVHGLRTTGEEITFTAQPKIHAHSRIFSYGRNIFCLPHLPKFSDFFDLCFHWLSVVCVVVHSTLYVLETFLAFLTEFNLVKAWN